MITALVLQVGSLRCVLPIEAVAEVMRPLPLVALAHHLPFTVGAAVVRGEAVPVVDLAALLGVVPGPVGRFVSVRADGGRVVLAVDSVAGVQTFADESFAALPPLLASADPAAPVAALAVRDRDIHMLLDAGRVFARPEEASS